MTEEQKRQLDHQFAESIALTAKLQAETAKLQAESIKMQREYWWYPFVLLTAVIGTTATIVKVFF